VKRQAKELLRVLVDHMNQKIESEFMYLVSEEMKCVDEKVIMEYEKIQQLLEIEGIQKFGSQFVVRAQKSSIPDEVLALPVGGWAICYLGLAIYQAKDYVGLWDKEECLNDILKMTIVAFNQNFEEPLNNIIDLYMKSIEKTVKILKEIKQFVDFMYQIYTSLESSECEKFEEKGSSFLFC